jgi:hypothetical protein
VLGFALVVGSNAKTLRMPMAATPPSNSNPSGDDRNTAAQAPVPLTFEEKLNQFWQRNSMVVLGLCAVVLVAILGKGIWEHVQRGKELDIEAAYAAATTPEQLKAFASSHAGHELAGVAELRAADEAYGAGKSIEAISGYDRAIAVLKDGPLASRARLGRALAKIQGGKASEGEAELKQIVADTTLFKTVRAEAAYHAASLAAEAGNADEVQKYVTQLNQIDPGSRWLGRAMALQAGLPKAATPAAPGVQVKVPGK